MKRLCESMLVPSRSNWLDLLRAAYLFNSPHLEVAVLGYLRDNIGSIAEVNLHTTRHINYYERGITLVSVVQL